MAIKTQGTELYVVDPADNSIIDVGCITSIDGIDTSVDTVETTCLNDSARTYLGGLATPSAATFEVNTDPTDPSHIRLHQLKTSGAMLQWGIGWSDGTSAPVAAINGDMIPGENRSWLMFEGYMSSFGFNFVENAVVSSTVGIQISGEPALIPFYDLPTATILSFFDGGGSGFYSSVDPQFEMAYTTATGNTLAANPGDPVGRVESLAGGLTLSQPISAARPVLGRYPEGGIRNLAYGTDNVGSPPSWTGPIPGIVKEFNSADIFDPWGGHLATKHTRTSAGALLFARYIGSTLDIGTYTSSVYVYIPSGQGFTGWRMNIDYNDTDVPPGFSSSLFDQWVRVEIVATTTATRTQIDLNFSPSSGGSLPDDTVVYLAGFMQQVGSEVTPYQSAKTPYDITEPGKRDIWSIYSNGTQWMTFGTDSFGTATLFAGAGQEWIGAYSAVTFAGGAGITKGGANVADRNLQEQINATTGALNKTIRGTSNPAVFAGPFNNGTPFGTVTRWDGSSATGYANNLPPVALTVGTATDESVDIAFLCINPLSPGNIMTGFAMPFLLDSAPAGAEMDTLRNALMAEAGV